MNTYPVNDFLSFESAAQSESEWPKMMSLYSYHLYIIERFRVPFKYRSTCKVVIRYIVIGLELN